MPWEVWDEITYPFLNVNGCPVEVKEWISNFSPHFEMDVITYIYPCWFMLFDVSFYFLKLTVFAAGLLFSMCKT